MNVLFKGVELRVEGSYTEGQITDYYSEDTSPTFEVYEVYAEDTDITALLSMEQIEEIELLILETL